MTVKQTTNTKDGSTLLMRKSAAAAAMAASLTFGAGAGVTLFAPNLVGAQAESSDDTTTTTPGDTGSTDTDDHADRGQWLEDTLAPLVDDGTIDQSQADAVIAAIEEARPERMRGPGNRLPILEDVTEVLGLSAGELRTAVEDGQTLAEIAEANGVETQAVIDALVATFGERIDDAVADGRMTEVEAAQKRAEAVDRATAIVNGEADLRRGPGGHGRFGAHDHADDTGSDDAGSGDKGESESAGSEDTGESESAGSEDTGESESGV